LIRPPLIKSNQIIFHIDQEYTRFATYSLTLYRSIYIDIGSQCVLPYYNALFPLSNRFRQGYRIVRLVLHYRRLY
jgi:hypothetical protein